MIGSGTSFFFMADFTIVQIRTLSSKTDCAMKSFRP